MTHASRDRHDVLCFSHLRWDFVYQRPQHLMSRAARDARVFFVEEPIYGGDVARLELREIDRGPIVVQPRLPEGAPESRHKDLIAELLARFRIERYVTWYYAPTALAVTSELTPRAAVYDCIDQPSRLGSGAAALDRIEAELLKRVDLVFTSGRTLYEAKRGLHPSVHAFPSAVDLRHFEAARAGLPEPADQAAIPGPRLGYVGVIDERIDLALLDAVAAARPSWQIVLVGPVVNVDPATLPRRDNIHYLGGKSYAELPAYVGGWDVALLPYARTDATRFISPSKTPEYLAAGRRVVATSIQDVVSPYGDRGLVAIADEPEAFVEATQDALLGQLHDPSWRIAVDAFLADLTWDRTFETMWGLVEEVIQRKAVTRAAMKAGMALPAQRERIYGSAVSVYR